MNTIGTFITDSVILSFTKVNRSNGKRKRIENVATINRVIDRSIAIKDIVVKTIDKNLTNLTVDNLFDTVYKSISDKDKRYLEAIIGFRTYRKCLNIIQYIINTNSGVSDYLTALYEHTNIGQRKQLINSMIMIIIEECIKILQSNTLNYNKYTRRERNTSRINTRAVNNTTRRITSRSRLSNLSNNVNVINPAFFQSPLERRRRLQEEQRRLEQKAVQNLKNLKNIKEASRSRSRSRSNELSLYLKGV
jgi:hypothetical protein